MSIEATCLGTVIGPTIEVVEAVGDGFGERKCLYRACVLDDADGTPHLCALIAAQKKHRRVLARLQEGWEVHVQGHLSMAPDEHASALGATSMVRIVRIHPPAQLKDSWTAAKGVPPAAADFADGLTRLGAALKDPRSRSDVIVSLGRAVGLDVSFAVPARQQEPSA